RFVLNVPEEDQQSFERILFLVEYAYYEDNAVENDPTLKSLSLKEFTSLLFNSCDVLRPYVSNVDDIFKDYACAMREVLEETGFDISKLLKKEEYIEFTFRQQRVRLYIVAGVADDTAFAPQTKKEISVYEIAWHWVDHLQPASNEVITHGVAGLKLYMVAPFLASLKSWISKHPAPVARRPDKPLRALSVWNAKTSIGGGNGTTTTTTESYNKKPEEQDTISGNAFRSFKFNMSAILQAVELG
uniref:mRNA decapping protein 2 Box A domain-containing protein n=2 Tax=Brassica oleracea var. oleracea TaxID=109376 RepID=A0A0D3B0Z3_BRAOL